MLRKIARGSPTLFRYLFVVGGSLVLLARQGFANEPPVTCLGTKGNAVLIYLHGIDAVAPTPQEISNRKILQSAAEKQGWRIAVVRSEKKCTDKLRRSELCWPMESRAILEKEAQRILKLSQQCGETVEGWLGFSNGGYFVSKLVQNCIVHPGWSVAIGSAGSWGSEKSSLRECGALTLVIGTKDITLANAKRYYSYLTSRQASVEFQTFAGGHEINPHVLAELLSARHKNGAVENPTAPK